MSRLPIVGGDVDDWGQILNDYLSVSLNADGTLKDSAIGATGPVGATGGVGATGPGLLPTGGTTGQALTKNSSTDNDLGWRTPLGWFNVKDYGALGNNSHDDTAAIQAAVNAAISGTISGGCIVYLPIGIYIISAPITIPAGTYLLGAGMGGCIIRAAASSTMSAMVTTLTGQFNYEITISDIQLDGNVTNGATVTNGFYGYGLTDSIIQRFRVVQVSGNGIQLDGSITYLGTANKVVNSFARACGIGLLTTSGSTDTLAQGCDFGDCTNQAFYIGGSNSSLVGSIGWGSLTGCSIDASALLTWISGCRFDNNELNGLYIVGKTTQVSGCLIESNSHASSGFYAGIEVASGAGDVVISGTRSIGFIAGIAGSTQQSYGLLLDAGRVGPATVTGCDFSGNGTGGISYTAVSGDRISNVTSFNPTGPQSAPSVPTSTTPKTNPFPFDCTVYLSGGSVSAVAIGGTTIGTGVGGIRLAAGQTITLTYSSAPSWVWIGD